jgi:hypothetical protein
VRQFLQELTTINGGPDVVDFRHKHYLLLATTSNMAIRKIPVHHVVQRQVILNKICWVKQTMDSFEA